MKKPELEILESKFVSVAKNYADLVEKRITCAPSQEIIDGTVLKEMSEGIRMLGYVTAALEKISRLDQVKETNG